MKQLTSAIIVFATILVIISTNAHAVDTLSKVNSLKHSISIVNAMQEAKEEENGNEPSVGALEQVLHDTTKNRRVELDDQVKEASEELKILMSACNGKKVEFDQRHTSRNEELETMGDLVQFLHQQLVIQQQKLSDSVELLKSGSLN